MEGKILLTMVEVTAILGIFIPPLTALIKRAPWSDRAKDMAVLILLVVVGVAAAFLTGDISPYACSALDLEGCVGVVIGYISLVVGQAFVWYKMFWKASGIFAKIAGK